ncbi:unnamed protein product, partial [marine sediment metagenome]
AIKGLGTCAEQLNVKNSPSMHRLQLLSVSFPW